MDNTAIPDQVKTIVEDCFRQRRLDLVEFVCRHEGKDLFLRILADRPEGGINIAECASLNKEIVRILDENIMLEQRYILEISSPGLDRVLKCKADFLRSLNKGAKFFLREAVGGKIEWDGVITNVDDNSVRITAGEKILEFPLEAIVKAKLLF